MEGSELSNSTARLGLLLARVKKKMQKRMSELLKPYGLTPEQRAILLALSEHAQMTQAHISQVTSTEPSNLSVTLKRLMQKEYINRIDHPDDPRAYLIQLSQKGESIINELLELSIFINKELMEGIEQEEFNITYETLEKIDNNLNL